MRKLLQELGNEQALRQLNLQAKLTKDLGLDSLAQVELLTRLEEAFGISFPEHIFLELSRPHDIVNALLKNAQDVSLLPQRFESLEQERIVLDLPETSKTLVEVLVRQAHYQGNNTHILLRTESGSDLPIRFKNLFEKAQVVANGLRQRGLQEQETVAIMLPTEENFFYAFLGVLLAGGVAVPLYPPFRADLLEEYATRQVEILKNASARIMITAGKSKAVALLLKPRVPSLLEVIEIPLLLQETQHEIFFPSVSENSPALIQYTSGSTGQPKGVLLSHGNLMANIRAIVTRLKVQPHDVCVSWLPLYHDMGLIGAWLCSLYGGNLIYILSPLAFLARPEQWLWAIHKHRGTISTAPNFAYELCIRRIKDESLTGLDLSSWRVALNGAEPVSPSTLERFVKKFEKYGFQEKALLPVYGLAESCVAVCFPPIDRGPRYDRVDRSLLEEQGKAQVSTQANALTFVGTGSPFPDHEVRLVDKEGKVLADRCLGRLHFRGPSLMCGYYRNEKATQEALKDGWCDSGDLAYRVDEDYFITGREKDLIIKGGRNLYPQEIEALVADVSGIRRGCVIAFGVLDEQSGTEQMIIAAEIKGERKGEGSFTEAIQKTLTEHLGTTADQILLLPPGAIPKTSSGKVRRNACKTMYLEKKLIRQQKSAFLQILTLGVFQTPSLLKNAFLKSFLGLWAIWYGIVCLLTIFPNWIILHFIRSPRLANPITRTFARLFLWLMGIRISFKDKQYLDGNACSLLVSNHTSYLDVVLYTAFVKKPFRFVSKQEAFRSPLIGPFLKSNGHLGVERENAQQSLEDKKEIQACLEKDLSVLIFPEATFTRAIGLRPFRLGAFQLAAETQRPLIPMAIHGARKCLPCDRWLLRPGKITLTFGAPLYAQSREWQEVLRLKEETVAFIEKHCGEPRLNLTFSDIPTS